MNKTLPQWIERALGLEPGDAGEGTVWSLDFYWNWAPWLTVVFIVATVGLVAFIYHREGGEAGRAMRILLGGLRLTAIVLVLFMLAEFAISLHRTGLPYVVVLVDDSASMGIADRYDDGDIPDELNDALARLDLDEPTRLNLAKAILLRNDARLLERLKRNHHLKLYFLSEVAREQQGSLDDFRDQLTGVTAAGASSRLGRGLRTVLNDLRGSPISAIVAFTDGVTTDGESLGEMADYVRRKGVRLFLVGLGNLEPVRDLEISDLLVDEVVFVDDMVNFEFNLSAMGLDDETVDVVLHLADDQAELAKIRVPAPADGQTQRLRLPFRPTQTGDFDFVVEVQTVEDEVSASNNRQKRTVRVRDEQVRVLLVQAYPNFEFRYLKQMLDRDSTVELNTVLQEADPEYVNLDQTALADIPVRQDELYEYDVLIFGDVNPDYLSASVMRQISDFVEKKGGGVIFIAGPRFTPTAFRGTPLEPMFPVEMEAVGFDEFAQQGGGFQPTPSEIGLTMPPFQLGDTFDESTAIWNRLPQLYWLLEPPRLRPGAVALAEHPTKLTAEGDHLPIIAMQYVGAGKVLYHATDETWRWRFQVGDVFFARYWVQAIRFLSRSKLLEGDRTAELIADRREYRRGESVRLRARFIDERQAPVEDDGVTLIVEHEGHGRQRMTLTRDPRHRGFFEGLLPQPADGGYHAWIAVPAFPETAPSADFTVVAPPGEMERLALDEADLRRAAELTEGEVYTLATALTLDGDLPRGRQVAREALPPLVLWNRWPLLLAFLLVLSTEWILRKWKGML